MSVTVGEFAQFAVDRGMKPLELLDLLLSYGEQLGGVCLKCSAQLEERGHRDLTVVV